MHKTVKRFRFGIAVIAITAAIATVPSVVGAIGATGNGPMTLQSGVYTPTSAAGSVNVSSVTFEKATWSRVGDTVTLSGSALVNAASGAFTALNFTLPSDAPYNPTTANMYDLSGATNAYQGVYSYAVASGSYIDTAQKAPRVWFAPTAAGNTGVAWTVQYQIK